LEGALDILAPRAAQKGLDLYYEISTEVPALVRGDATRLRQVLVNLMGNAVKFTERGEIEVCIVPEAPISQGLSLHLSVRDTGIGIPVEAQARLFTSFTQVDASTTRKYGGTGLGLAISRRLAELMGGRMWVESEPGKGSTFHFSILVEAADPASDQTARMAPPPRLRGKRLLIVDDSATGLRMLARLAGDWGMRTTALESGLDALERLRAGESFDLGILDMEMREMDGITLAHELRLLPGGSKLPLLLLSLLGRYESDEEAELFEARLSKPTKPAALLEAIERVFEEDSEAPFAISSAPESAAATEEQPERLLLAEDNAVNQKVALYMLSKLGYTADVVMNGQEAVAAVRRHHYDVVFMDMQMPKMDGLEATRRILESHPERGRRPWIIALTANAMEGDRERCEKAGMDDYLSKPMKISDVASALARARIARLGA
jgi:CheY-like chemotaxis protein